MRLILMMIFQTLGWTGNLNRQELKKGYQNYLPYKTPVNEDGLVGKGALYYYIPGTVRFCPYCGKEFQPRQKDSNKLTGLSGEGRSSATTTMITLSVLNHLFGDEDSNASDIKNSWVY